MVFPQLWGKCQGKTCKDGARPALFQIFVLFYVLFVCKCVLYCCHWVATQLQLTNISYHIKSHTALAVDSEMCTWNIHGIIPKGENWNIQNKSCPSSILPTTYFTYPSLGLKPGLWGDRPAISYLSHGTVETAENGMWRYNDDWQRNKTNDSCSPKERIAFKQ